MGDYYTNRRNAFDDLRKAVTKTDKVDLDRLTYAMLSRYGYSEKTVLSLLKPLEEIGQIKINLVDRIVTNLSHKGAEK